MALAKYYEDIVERLLEETDSINREFEEIRPDEVNDSLKRLYEKMLKVNEITTAFRKEILEIVTDPENDRKLELIRLNKELDEKKDEIRSLQIDLSQTTTQLERINNIHESTEKDRRKVYSENTRLEEKIEQINKRHKETIYELKKQHIETINKLKGEHNEEIRKSAKSVENCERRLQKLVNKYEWEKEVSKSRIRKL